MAKRHDWSKPTVRPTPPEAFPSAEVWLLNNAAAENDAPDRKPSRTGSESRQYSSCHGESILDLFGGSGSTPIGCEQTGRRAFLMEMDTLYRDVIVQRWEACTGREAERTTEERGRR